jgi:hypothetical protein
MPALMIHAFDGDHAGPIANRLPNEILFTAYWADTAEPADISEFGFTAVQLAPPAAPYYFVTLVRESPWIYRAKLAVFEGTELPPEGVYLFNLQLGTSRGLGGFAIATARITADMPRIPLPASGEEYGELLARYR